MVEYTINRIADEPIQSSELELPDTFSSDSVPLFFEETSDDGTGKDDSDSDGMPDLPPGNDVPASFARMIAKNPNRCLKLSAGLANKSTSEVISLHLL